MEIQMIFHILGIPETRDQQIIQDAYRKKLGKTNPEDDPEGFKKLRTAYEEAMKSAEKEQQKDSREQEEEGEREKTPLELWLDQADGIYRDMDKRRDRRQWEELLAAPLCEDLDTFLETREAFLSYLMNHGDLPHTIWQLLDQTFQIREDREILEEAFPSGFLDYMISGIEREEFLQYDLFQVLNREQMDGDAYIRHYFEIKEQLDNGQYEGCERKLEELKAFGLYHPYEDAALVRLMIVQERAREGAALSRKLLALYGENIYIRLIAAEAFWNAGEREEAGIIWKELHESYPSNFSAMDGLIRWYLDRGEYRPAKDLVLALDEQYGRSDLISGYLETANEGLIKEYETLLSNSQDGEEERPGTVMELGWCLFQNGRAEEAIRLLEKIVPDEEHQSEYHQLLGRAFDQEKQYEEALSHLKISLEMVQKEKEERKQTKFRLAYHIGLCCFNLEQREEALEWAEKAKQEADRQEDWVAASFFQSRIQFDRKEYGRCMEVCEQILDCIPGYFPACCQHLEAAFEAGKGQQVVDDYYQAIRMNGRYFRPYLLAAQVFFDHNQAADAKGVMEQAHENQVEFSDRMRLLEIQILRELAEDDDSRDHLIASLTELKGSLSPDTDLADPSEIEFELFWLMNEKDQMWEAISHLEKAMKENPGRGQYHMVMGDILANRKLYGDAIGEYKKAGKPYSSYPLYHYNIGCCYEKMGRDEEARKKYLECLECQEDYQNAWRKLCSYYGRAYLKSWKKEDHDQAMEYANRLIAKEENRYDLVNRGRLYAEAYDFDHALADFEKALTYDEYTAYTYCCMGNCYWTMGQLEKAVELFERSAAAMSEDYFNSEPFQNAAECCRALGQYERAIEWCERGLQWFPDGDDGEIFAKMSLYYRALGQYEKALECLDHVAGDSDYYCYRVGVYYRMGKKEEGLRFLEQALSQEQDPNEQAGILEDMSNYYAEYNIDLARAARLLEEALAKEGRASHQWNYRWRAGALFFRCGDLKKARYYGWLALKSFQDSKTGNIENYLDYRPYRSARLRSLAWIYICLGETQKGLSYLEEMEHCRCEECRWKGCYESFQYRGFYYEAVGEYEKALECYEKALELYPDDAECALRAADMRKILEGRKQAGENEE